MRWNHGFMQYVRCATIAWLLLLVTNISADEPAVEASPLDVQSVPGDSSAGQSLSSACCNSGSRGGCDSCSSGCNSGCNSCLSRRNSCGCYEYPLGGGASRQELWSSWLWAGPTTTEFNSNSEAGLAYGTNLGYRLAPAFGIFGGVGLNHVDGATQTLGTVGFQRFGNPCGQDAVDRTTAWFFYDHFNQSGSGNSTDQGQVRFQLGYVFNDRFEAGASFSTETKDDGGGGGLTPLGSASTLFPGQDFSGAYLNYRVNRADVGFSLGHSDATDGIAGGIQAGIPISGRRDRKIVIGGAAADDTFTANLYYSVGLGRADTTHH